MNDDLRHKQELLLASIERAVAAAGGDESARRFAGQYFAPVSYAMLARYDARRLADIALRHYRLAAQRLPGEPLVQIDPPASTQDLARVFTVFDDMPFLVDSIGIAVRAEGSLVDWSIHPVLAVRRDEQGQLGRVQVGGDGTRESFVCMEIASLSDDTAYEALTRRITASLRDVRQVVEDFPAMQAVAERIAGLLKPPIKGLQDEWVTEARDFVEWLRDHHFTFLGYAFARAERQGGEVRLKIDTGQSLGLLRPDACFGDADSVLAPAETLARYATSQRLVIITKANVRSHIHHPLPVDALSVKELDAEGQIIGTHRFIGLFSSDAYIDRPNTIPVVRQKVAEVLKRSRLDAESHSGKKLRDILHQLPRDELFQSSEEELHALCTGVRALRDRQQLRLFLRRDRYGRFFTALVYVPRERYSSELRDTICDTLLEALGGTALERNVDFPRGEAMARVYAVITVRPEAAQQVQPEVVERQLLEATRSWGERLTEALTSSGEIDQAQRWAKAFDAGYQQVTSPLAAAADVYYLQRLDEKTPLLPRLVVDESAVGSACPTELRLYARGQPAALSDILPRLEHFGLRVTRQSPFRVRPGDETLWVQAFDVQVEHECALDPAAQKALFEDAMLRVFAGENEDDGLHRLVLAAGLDARQIVMLRALTRYLVQTGLPYSRSVLENLLAEHGSIARDLVALFEARFDPDITGDRETRVGEFHGRLEAALEAVASLDADRGLRAYLGVIDACLRTNFYQVDESGAPKSRVTLKLDPSRIVELPEPRPKFETFVYAPEVEGVHLRGGPVARGGLRWSDRHTDFRTEVLGLMKAQMVKNAIIVPEGAKGGFIVKQRSFESREAFLEAGKRCYQTFIRGLLDITDNRLGDEVVPPPRVVRADGDDPYLVVAADKGTATFSDVANAISAEYDFWLGDAFASGGSAGYDHKKMGITARGAWESVKRHFREMGRDIQREPFTVVGVGDMAGDVFGNGMLLSEQTRLVAAFNHMHIFIDPDPDPATSYAERKRLFEMGRSTWDDYKREAISEGGGIWPRSAKRIELSPQAREALGIDAEVLTPSELLRAILLAPVDLLWNGGIGTYVKAATESHQDVGDRANDAIRVNGRELRVKVVGEGGNLGLTQLGRIEYALSGGDGEGGRINTDAIDNSGGVHSSDREVNIKIPLNACMAAGALGEADRNALLEAMTEEVAEEVLADNHEQSLAVSLIQREAPERLDEHGHTMRALEREAGLNRAVEFLPDDEVLNERRARRQGLSRPEIAVVLAYAKNTLFKDLIASDVPDDPALESRLQHYFPEPMRRQYHDAIGRHRLRREIIATQLANQVVNRMGFSFVHRLAEDQGVPRHKVVKAFALAWELMHGDAHAEPVDALDGKIDGTVQLKIYARGAGLLKHVTTWALAEHLADAPMADSIAAYAEGVGRIHQILPEALPEDYRADFDAAVAQWMEHKVPEDVARLYAGTLVMGSAPDIVRIARDTDSEPEEAAAVYFALGQRLHVLWLLSSIIGLQVSGRYQALARANLREDVYRLHRRLANRVMREAEGDGAERVERWLAEHEEEANPALARLRGLRSYAPHDFMTLAVGVRALRQLRTL